MASLNKVQLIGNLGKDPRVAYMPNGDCVTNITIATTETWKDKDGQKQEKTEWHRITFYRKLAEIAGEYLKQGKQVYVEGKLQTSKYTKDGVDRYTTEIIASDMKMLGGKRDDEGKGEYQAPAQAEKKPQAVPAGGGFDDMTDDIPF